MKRFLSFIFIALITIVNTHASEQKEFKILYLVDNNNNLDVKDYEKSLKIIEANKLKKEEHRKIKLQAAIKEIESQGFEVDQENETLKIVKRTETEPFTYEGGYVYEYDILNYENLEKINNLSNKYYKLKLPNEIGDDFIIDYKTSLLEYGFIGGTNDTNKISYKGDTSIIEYSDIGYSANYITINIILKKNQYMEDLTFKYRTEKGKLELIVNLDPNTGKKVFSQPNPNH